MYKYIALISFYVRFFVLPNPFKSFQNGIIINYIAEPIIHAVTFGIVGLFYSRRSNSSLGSFLYFIFYCINICLIQLWALVGASVIAAMIITLIYLIILFWVVSRVNEF